MKNIVLIPRIIRGGAELQCIYFCNELAQNNIETELLVIKDIDYNLREYIDPRVKIVCFRKSKGKFINLLIFLVKIYSYIILNKPDRINTFLSYSEKIIFPLLVLIPSLSSFSFVRSKITKSNKVGNFFGFLIGNFYTNIIVNDKNNIQPAIAFYKRLPLYMPNHINLNNYNLRPVLQQFFAIYVARFIPEKNHDFILEYLNIYQDNLSNPILFCSSDNPPPNILKKSNNFISNSKLVINKDCSDIPLFLNKSKICLFTSYYSEGMPNSLLEAMACFIPIVCTDKLKKLNMPILYYRHNDLKDFNRKILQASSINYSIDVNKYTTYLESLKLERREFIDENYILQSEQ